MSAFFCDEGGKECSMPRLNKEKKEFNKLGFMSFKHAIFLKEEVPTADNNSPSS